MAARDRRVGDALAQVADVVDRVVRRRVHLDDVERRRARRSTTHDSHVAARLDRRPAARSSGTRRGSSPSTSCRSRASRRTGRRGGPCPARPRCAACARRAPGRPRRRRCAGGGGGTARGRRTRAIECSPASRARPRASRPTAVVRRADARAGAARRLGAAARCALARSPAPASSTTTRSTRSSGAATSPTARCPTTTSRSPPRRTRCATLVGVVLRRRSATAARRRAAIVVSSALPRARRARLGRLRARRALVRPGGRRARRGDRPHARAGAPFGVARVRRHPLPRARARRAARRDAPPARGRARCSRCSRSPACCVPRRGCSRSPTSRGCWRGARARGSPALLALAARRAGAVGARATSSSPATRCTRCTGTRDNAQTLGRDHRPERRAGHRAAAARRDPARAGAVRRGGRRGPRALWLRDRARCSARPPASSRSVAFCVLAAAGLPILGRYLLLPAAILLRSSAAPARSAGCELAARATPGAGAWRGRRRSSSLARARRVHPRAGRPHPRRCAARSRARTASRTTSHALAARRRDPRGCAAGGGAEPPAGAAARAVARPPAGRDPIGPAHPPARRLLLLSRHPPGGAQLHARPNDPKRLTARSRPASGPSHATCHGSCCAGAAEPR